MSSLSRLPSSSPLALAQKIPESQDRSPERAMKVEKRKVDASMDASIQDQERPTRRARSERDRDDGDTANAEGHQSVGEELQAGKERRVPLITKGERERTLQNYNASVEHFRDYLFRMIKRNDDTVATRFFVKVWKCMRNDLLWLQRQDDIARDAPQWLRISELLVRTRATLAHFIRIVNDGPAAIKPILKPAEIKSLLPPGVDLEDEEVWARSVENEDVALPNATEQRNLRDKARRLRSIWSSYHYPVAFEKYFGPRILQETLAIATSREGMLRFTHIHDHFKAITLPAGIPPLTADDIEHSTTSYEFMLKSAIYQLLIARGAVKDLSEHDPAIHIAASVWYGESISPELPLYSAEALLDTYDATVAALLFGQLTASPELFKFLVIPPLLPFVSDRTVMQDTVRLLHHHTESAFGLLSMFTDKDVARRLLQIPESLTTAIAAQDLLCSGCWGPISISPALLPSNGYARIVNAGLPSGLLLSYCSAWSRTPTHTYLPLAIEEPEPSLPNNNDLTAETPKVEDKPVTLEGPEPPKVAEPEPPKTKLPPAQPPAGPCPSLGARDRVLSKEASAIQSSEMELKHFSDCKMSSGKLTYALSIANAQRFSGVALSNIIFKLLVPKLDPTTALYSRLGIRPGSTPDLSNMSEWRTEGGRTMPPSAPKTFAANPGFLIVAPELLSPGATGRILAPPGWRPAPRPLARAPASSLKPSPGPVPRPLLHASASRAMPPPVPGMRLLAPAPASAPPSMHELDLSDVPTKPKTGRKPKNPPAPSPSASA